MLKIRPYEARKGKFYYMTTEPYENEYVRIPESFYFDGLTIPRLFWSLLGTPCDPMTVEAGLTHDFLYYCKHDRKEADMIFYKLLIESGASKWRAKALYYGVRLICGFRYDSIPTNEIWKDYFKK